MRLKREKVVGYPVTSLQNFGICFFISAAVGASEKVPTIRHDFQSGEWEAIARILV